jgi:hypothetical protein
MHWLQVTKDSAYASSAEAEAKRRKDSVKWMGIGGSQFTVQAWIGGGCDPRVREGVGRVVESMPRTCFLLESSLHRWIACSRWVNGE